jgi:hypothetical protein
MSNLGWNLVPVQPYFFTITNRINDLAETANTWAEEAIEIANEIGDFDVGTPTTDIPGAEITDPPPVAAPGFRVSDFGLSFDIPDNPVDPPSGDVRADIESWSGTLPSFPSLSLDSPARYDGELPTFSGELPEPPAISDREYVEFAGEAPPTTISVAFPDIPAAPSVSIPPYTLPARTYGAAPAKPVISFPTFGGISEKEVPVFTGSLDVGVAPAPPSVPVVEFPTLDTDLAIPEAIEIVLDELAATRPDDPDFEFGDVNPIADATAATSALLANGESVINTPATDKALFTLGEMADGKTGLPPAIEEALFARAIARDDKKSRQDLDQAMGEWARRGFSMPGSSILQKLAAVRQQNRESTCTVGRELAIQLHQEQLVSIRQAVENGIRLQGQLQSYYQGLASTGIQIAEIAFRVAEAIFNGRIAVFRSQVDLYQAEVAVYAEKIRAEVAKVDIYRGQIEAARLRGEINEQRVRIYTAQVNATTQLIQQYQAQIDAYRARVEVKGLELDQYRTRVAAFSEEINAERLKVDAYQAQISAESNKVGLYDSEVRAFGSLVQAYQAEVGASETGTRAAIAEAEAKSRLWATEANTVSDTAVARLQAKVAEANNAANIYGTLVDAHARQETAAINARSNVDASRVNLYTAQTRAISDFETAAANVEGIRARSHADLERVKVEGQSAINRAETEAYVAQVRGTTDFETARINASATAVQAEAQAFSAQAGAYADVERSRAAAVSANAQGISATADANRVALDAEVADVEAAQRNNQLRVQVQDARARVAAARAQQYTEQLRTLGQLRLGQLDAAARVQAQLAASALAAVNLSAGISETSNVGSTHSSNYSLNEQA